MVSSCSMQNLPLHTGESADQSPVIKQVMVSYDDNENPGWHAKKAVELTEILCAKSLQYRYLERRSMDKIFLKTDFKSNSTVSSASNNKTKNARKFSLTSTVI